MQVGFQAICLVVHWHHYNEIDQGTDSVLRTEGRKYEVIAATDQPDRWQRVAWQEKIACTGRTRLPIMPLMPDLLDASRQSILPSKAGDSTYRWRFVSKSTPLPRRLQHDSQRANHLRAERRAEVPV